jgi:hypothetical protein
MISWLREKLALGFMFMAMKTDYDAFMTLCEVVVIAEHIEEIRDAKRLEQEHDHDYNQKEHKYDVFH